VPIFAHLALVLIAGVYIPAAMVAWFQNVAGLLK
jgi:hydrogenase-4 component F